MKQTLGRKKQFANHVFLGVFLTLGGVSCGRPGEPLTEVGTQDSGQRPTWAARDDSRDADFLSVTRERGPLVVKAGVQERELSKRPWSGWWLPVNSSYLFQGTADHPSPLEKFDAFAKKVGTPTRATDFERREIYDPNAIAWEGSCDAWAIASLLEPEPVAPITREGIVFSVGDQKALLVKSYELAEGKKFYGQAFHGTREGVYDDLYPDQLQRFVETELIEGGRPFVLDKDPGVAVWNTPVWHALIRIEDDAGDPEVVHGFMTLWGADPWVRNVDDTGTRTIALEYTYDLFGPRRADGALEVRFAVWTHHAPGPNSIELHPDFVATIPEKVSHRGSRNSELSPAIVDRIFGH